MCRSLVSRLPVHEGVRVAGSIAEAGRDRPREGILHCAAAPCSPVSQSHNCRATFTIQRFPYLISSSPEETCRTCLGFGRCVLFGMNLARDATAEGCYPTPNRAGDMRTVCLLHDCSMHSVHYGTNGTCGEDWRILPFQNFPSLSVHGVFSVR